MVRAKRVQWILPSLAVICVCILLAGSGAAGNLVNDPGFESEGVPAWPIAGKATIAKKSQLSPHSGTACMYVADDGDTGGQANNARFAALPGMYYVEGWMRVDPEHPGTARLDVQFFNEKDDYLGAELVGDTRSTEWALLAAFVRVPETAASVRLRVQPAFGARELRGACFVDDLYMAPEDEAKHERQVHARHEIIACSNADPGGKVGKRPPDIRDKPQPYKSQVDFEDLAGWRMEVFGNLTGSFWRSQEEPLAGRYVGKLSFCTNGELDRVVLRPPKPIPLNGRFEAAQIWVHCDRRADRGDIIAPQITIVLDENGKIRLISLPSIVWSYWSIAHLRGAPGAIGPKAEIVELRVDRLQTAKGQTRALYLDELAFHNEPTAPVDLKIPEVPCPTRPETILPTCDRHFENRVTSDGGVFHLRYQGDDGTVEYTYRPRHGALDDLTVKVNGRLGFFPASGGGPVLAFSEKKGLAATLVRADMAGDAVTSVWRYQAGQDSAEVTIEMRLRGKSLILTVDEPQGKVASWLMGQPEGVPAQEIAVPYLTGHCEAAPVWLVGKEVFAFWQPDWYVAHASQFGPKGCEYIPLVNGRRNPLHERIFLTVSTDFHEVLPNIPNPKSPVAHVLGEYVYANVSASLEGDGFERCLGLFRQMKGLGMEKIIVKHHAQTFSSHSGQGDEPFVQRVKASSNIPGGDAALANYIRQVKALGYQYFLYTDYCIFAPVCAHFDEGLVALNPSGQWTPGWYQYYVLTPLMAPVLAARFAPQLEAKYGNTGSYCDQHTAAPPSRWVDYDPRKPGAGMLQTVFRAYCRVFQAEKEAYNGPAPSEGGNYWFYAGMADGSYAQLSAAPTDARWQVPFLVDFDLLKIHPLEVDLGMGWRKSYGYDDHAKNWDDALDRFHCATIAFGHSGILYSPNFPTPTATPKEDPLDKWKRSVVRTYFMIQQLASRYALVPVRNISYWDGRRLISPSDALRSGAYTRSQVAVEYENGLRVWVNGSFEEPWRVQADSQTYDLPPNGWLAIQGAEFLEYSAMKDGHRVDFVRSPVYTFADGRGVLTDFGGGVKAKEAVIVLHGRGDERHEVDCPMGP